MDTSAIHGPTAMVYRDAAALWSTYGAERTRIPARDGECASDGRRTITCEPPQVVASACRRAEMVRNAMKKGLPRSHAPRVLERRREAHAMLYAGLDLSRKRLDFHLLDAEGASVDVGAAPPDADGCAD
jgi:hypothetical protein